MTLKEMAKEYRAAAELLRNRLKELRYIKKNTDDANERWHIDRRINELSPLLTETRKVADILENYYEPGYWRDPNYTTNVKHSSKSGLAHTNNIEHDDRAPAGYIHSVLLREEEYGRNSEATKRKNKHSIENLGSR